MILDEADRMLDMGFREDVEKIIRKCPANRQTLLFSATIDEQIKHITRKHMKDPIRLSGEAGVDPKKLKQVYYDVQNNLKFSLLVHLLKNERSVLTMIFCNTRKRVDFVANNLKNVGIQSLAIHGGFSQNRRGDVIKQFHNQRGIILVCTDVASRGLDIKEVSHIYNYDSPKLSKDYIHRIGRTARAGKEGKVINLIASSDHDNFSRVLKEYHIHIPKEPIPKLEKIEIKWEGHHPFRGQQNPHRGGFHRKRYYKR